LWAVSGDAPAAAAATRRRGDAGERSEEEIFRDQIGMLAQAVAGTLDVGDDGVVQEAIEPDGGNAGMARWPKTSPYSAAALFEVRIRRGVRSAVDQLEK
jgi:hypothetical protein